MSHGPGPRRAPNQKAKDFRGTWKRLLRELRPERVRITTVMVLTTAAVVLNVAAPKVMARATNVIFAGVLGKLLESFGLPHGLSGDQLEQVLRAAGQDTYADMLSAYDVVVGQGLDSRALMTILVQTLTLYLLSALFLWAQARILAGVVQRTGQRMRAEVADKLDRVPLSYIDHGSRGDMLSRVTNDVDNITQTLQQTISQALNSIITVVGVFTMMLTVSVQLSLVSLATLPVALVITLLIASRAQPHFTAQWDATGDVSGVVEEAFTGHEAVTLFNSQETFNELFEQENNRLYEGSYKAQWISGTIQPAMRVVSNLNFVIIAVIGGVKITSGQMTLGDVQAFIQYSQQFTQPITQLASMANLLQSGAASAERLFEIMDAPEETDSARRALPERVAGRVVFDHVRFSYSPDTELITDLNLTVEPGQTVAIVGPTGAGKTTLVNLLLRFYDPQGGSITLDGIDTRELARNELREQIGMVLQDTWLFEGTIGENIAFGSAHADEEQVRAAARAASVDHIVRSLPDGYNTVIDDAGAGVSAGEKQLITIARAFLADRQILVLDEATSSVDTRTELLVQKAMVELRQGRTSFVIAHRLSTIRDADIILVMEHGDIVEQGSHEQLMAARGAYYELYQSQFSGPEAAEDTAVTTDPILAAVRRGGRGKTRL
ncbi:multidrug ABC transporter ATP-binding protein [Actinomyces sp. 432]|uniref:ABC transporter ATP-binding protein n=1 Tax=unclassified Actinomyces TaxID=2609248 RepID=UPI001373D833|nr:MULTISPECIES: ABC transporter ATP-binding protein [unclassified Actinomyces]MBW3068187.1 ABC transporter ATP-binding protein [Actinomyces sp. 594]QHO91113.1 multidrug ABC transporter ATP-binding protein [Actinomyces sp. 432]